MIGLAEAVLGDDILEDDVADVGTVEGAVEDVASLGN
jgi:hypothetical protein